MVLKLLNTGSDAVMINELVDISATISPLFSSPAGLLLSDVSLPPKGELPAFDEIEPVVEAPLPLPGSGGRLPSLFDRPDVVWPVPLLCALAVFEDCEFDSPNTLRRVFATSVASAFLNETICMLPGVRVGASSLTIKDSASFKRLGSLARSTMELVRVSGAIVTF